MPKTEKKTWIAISGTMASGKSSVLAYLKSLGYPTIDCDSINTNLQKKGEKGYLEILNQFGYDILDENEEIDRKKLAAIIFSNEKKKQQLENILHPLILEKCYEFKEKTNGLMFVEVPLLYELGWEKFFDEHWLITCSLKTCYKRCLKYRNMTKEQVSERINQQMDNELKKKKASVIIYNDTSLDDLYKKIDELLERS